MSVNLPHHGNFKSYFSFSTSIEKESEKPLKLKVNPAFKLFNEGLCISTPFVKKWLLAILRATHHKTIILGFNLLFSDVLSGFTKSSLKIIPISPAESPIFNLAHLQKHKVASLNRTSFNALTNDRTDYDVFCCTEQLDVNMQALLSRQRYYAAAIRRRMTSQSGSIMSTEAWISRNTLLHCQSLISGIITEHLYEKTTNEVA